MKIRIGYDKGRHLVAQETRETKYQQDVVRSNQKGQNKIQQERIGQSNTRRDRLEKDELDRRIVCCLVPLSHFLTMFVTYKQKSDHFHIWSIRRIISHSPPSVLVSRITNSLVSNCLDYCNSPLIITLLKAVNYHLMTKCTGLKTTWYTNISIIWIKQ